MMKSSAAYRTYTISLSVAMEIRITINVIYSHGDKEVLLVNKRDAAVIFVATAAAAETSNPQAIRSTRLF